jgi:nuclear receptor co-repressor 1
LSPRYDGILRQTPPQGDKIGSITQGTPVHLPTHHLPEKRLYEMYKTKGGPPPHQQQQGSSPQNLTPQQQQQQGAQAPPFGSQYGRPVAYQLDPQPQLSFRQIIQNDYNTSQQMHGQQNRSGPTVGSGSSGGPPPGRNSDKDTPSPRNSSGQLPSHVAPPAAALYYAEKERAAVARSDYLSRTSPAEHINSTPSPHRTPPPQRQGVIQRHNTVAGSKPPSPASSAPSSRLHMVQPHHYLPPGHEAFSSLVDVAVQQPLLPVPHKDEKQQRQQQQQQPPVSVTISEPPSQGGGGGAGGQSPGSHHHDIRYHPMPSREQQMAMQIQQQRQHQMVSLCKFVNSEGLLKIF